MEILSATSEPVRQLMSHIARGLLMRLIRHPWFGPAALAGVVLFVVFLAIWIPLKRRIALATKPREVTRPSK